MLVHLGGNRHQAVQEFTLRSNDADGAAEGSLGPGLIRNERASFSREQHPCGDMQVRPEWRVHGGAQSAGRDIYQRQRAAQRPHFPAPPFQHFEGEDGGEGLQPLSAAIIRIDADQAAGSVHLESVQSGGRNPPRTAAVLRDVQLTRAAVGHPRDSDALVLDQGNVAGKQGMPTA